MFEFVFVRSSVTIPLYIETEPLPRVPLYVQAMHRARAPLISVAKAMLLALWMLANVAYAGMRAQDSPAAVRAVAFTAGLPATLVTMAVVDVGSERAYGVSLPRR